MKSFNDSLHQYKDAYVTMALEPPAEPPAKILKQGKNVDDEQRWDLLDMLESPPRTTPQPRTPPTTAAIDGASTQQTSPGCCTPGSTKTTSPDYDLSPTCFTHAEPVDSP
jgi:hypothetical protein